MYSRHLSLLLLAGLFALPSCMIGSHSIGAPLALDGNTSSLLTVGKTTKNDVMALFGAPTEIRSTHDGDVFRYLYKEAKQDTVDIGLSALFGLVSLSFFRAEEDREATENLTVFFCSEGKLLGWSYTPLAR